MRSDANQTTALPIYPRIVLKTAIAFLFLCTAVPSFSQGCAQCLDSTRATPPQVQASYRHAIYLMGGTAALLFLAGIAILRNESR